MTPPPPPLSVMKGFIKGEALRLLRTNSTKNFFFEENIRDLKLRLRVQELLVRQEVGTSSETKNAQENIAHYNPSNIFASVRLV